MVMLLTCILEELGPRLSLEPEYSSVCGFTSLSPRKFMDSSMSASIPVDYSPTFL